MHTPYKTSRLPDTKHYTYLDVQGRPVVTIKNVGELTEKHIQDFQLEFDLPRYVDFIYLRINNGFPSIIYHWGGIIPLIPLAWV